VHAHPILKGQKVTRIEWHIQLENLKSHLCPIVFRNPHSLVNDAPEFKTLLFQAYYAYLEMMGQMRVRDDDLDYPLRMALIGWEVIVTHTLHDIPVEWNFLSDRSEAGDAQQILEMANKLPLALERYQSAPSFYPECSGTSLSCDHKNEDSFFWLQGAKKQPLFIFSPAIAFTPEKFHRKTFLERSSSLWWQGEVDEGERNYYIFEENKKLYWVYQDSNGEWFKHGLFS
jgi:hypothetical protein